MGDEESDGAVELTAMRSGWQSIGIAWGLTEKERRELLPAGGEFDVEPPADTVTRMRLLVEIGHRLRFEDRAELRDWLRRPVLMFALDCPLEVMSGPIEDLVRLRGLVERGFGS